MTQVSRVVLFKSERERERVNLETPRANARERERERERDRKKGRTSDTHPLRAPKISLVERSAGSTVHHAERRHARDHMLCVFIMRTSSAFDFSRRTTRHSSKD